MSLSGPLRGLCPVALTLADLGVGAGLYMVGAFVVALVMWLTGALIIFGSLYSAARLPSRSGHGTH